MLPAAGIVKVRDAPEPQSVAGRENAFIAAMSWTLPELEVVPRRLTMGTLFAPLCAFPPPASPRPRNWPPRTVTLAPKLTAAGKLEEPAIELMVGLQESW